MSFNDVALARDCSAILCYECAREHSHLVSGPILISFVNVVVYSLYSEIIPLSYITGLLL